MATRKVKCQYCEGKEPYSERYEMSVIIKGKRNLYFHNECVNKYQEEQEFKRIEEAKLDEVAKKVMKLHGVDVLPSWFYTELQDLRNGTQRYRSNRKLRYKEGIPYEAFTESYKMKGADIRWAKLNKHFKKPSDEIRYCWVVAKNGLPDAMKRLKKRERQAEIEKLNEKEEEKTVSFEEDRKTEYKKKKSEQDISDFLD